VRTRKRESGRQQCSTSRSPLSTSAMNESNGKNKMHRMDSGAALVGSLFWSPLPKRSFISRIDDAMRVLIRSSLAERGNVLLTTDYEDPCECRLLLRYFGVCANA
jgi:hypothetical protein